MDPIAKKFFLDQNLPFLSKNAAQSISLDPESEEIESVIHMFANRGPGEDGLTAPFYQKFSHILAPTLVKVFKDFLSNNHPDPKIHQLFLFGLIAPIPKKVTSIKSFSHIRPISLLNLDYKILSKLIYLRIKPYLSDLIHPDQTGYVPGRFILSNSVALELILNHAEAIHLFIDFSKAFDSMQHESKNFL